MWHNEKCIKVCFPAYQTSGQLQFLPRSTVFTWRLLRLTHLELSRYVQFTRSETLFLHPKKGSQAVPSIDSIHRFPSFQVDSRKLAPQIAPQRLGACQLTHWRNRSTWVMLVNPGLAKKQTGVIKNGFVSNGCKWLFLWDLKSVKTVENQSDLGI